MWKLPTVDELEDFRTKADPVGDKLIKDIIDTGETRHVNVIFDMMRRNKDIGKEHLDRLPESMRTLVKDYFDMGKQLPDWADEDLIKKGEEVYQKFGPEISLLLLVMALPLCYSSRKGAKVLVMTGRTLDPSHDVDPLARRLIETSQFVVDAMQPGGLSPSGSGILATLRVRLIHASIRHYIFNHSMNPKGWDTDEYGLPINQEDMAGTLCSFSALVIHGLELMGLRLSKAEKDAYMHCWKIVGYYEGLDPKLLPDTYEQGWDLGVAILKHQCDHSDDCVALTKSCKDYIKAVMPNKFADNLVESLIYYFTKRLNGPIGQNIPAVLGIDKELSAWRKFEIKVMELLIRFMVFLQTKFPFISKKLEHITDSFLLSMSKEYNRGKGINFDIPPGLRKDWGIQ